MEDLKKIVAAGFLAFNFISCAGAAGSEVLRSAGLSAEAAAMPEVPVPASAAAGQAEAGSLDLFRNFGRAETPQGVPVYRQKDAGEPDRAPVASIKLEPIRNIYLKTAITFNTAAGTKVHVSGTKAANCPDGGTSCEDKEKFFLVLTTARNESYFIRAMEIVNWGIFYSGSKKVAIDGEDYVVKILADASDNEKSELEVRGPRGVALKTTLGRVGEAVAAKGVDLRLSKGYKLAYGNEIVQGPQGGHFTSKLLLLLIPFPVDGSSYYLFDTADIKPSGVGFPGFERGYSFALQGGLLRISRI